MTTVEETLPGAVPLGPAPLSGLEARLRCLRGLYCLHVRLRSWQRGQLSDYGAQAFAPHDGGVDSRGCLHQGVWRKLADFCQDRQLSPEQLIRGPFYGLQGDHPQPLQLMGENNVKKARLYPGLEMQEKARRLFQAECACARTAFEAAAGLRTNGWTSRQIDVSVLADESLPLSPLLRYAVAFSRGLQLAGYLGRLALVQYLGAPELYDAVWGPEWLPVLLRAEARRQLAEAVTQPVPGSRSSPARDLRSFDD